MSDDQTPAEEFNEVADAAVDEIIALKAEVQALKDQMLRVAAIGIEVGQGFHFAQPVPREAAADMVAATWRVTPGARSVVA